MTRVGIAPVLVADALCMVTVEVPDMTGSHVRAIVRRHKDPAVREARKKNRAARAARKANRR